MHIEFIGPPGSGKSTIFNTLTHNTEFFASSHVLAKAGLPKPLNIGYKYLPDRVRRSIWSRCLKWPYFIDFSSKNSCAISIIFDEITRVGYDHDHLLDLVIKTIAIYQLSEITCPKQKTLCLDEGFMQRAISISLRKPKFDLPSAEYFDSVPLPKVVIFVAASENICNRRQQARGREITTKEWFDHHENPHNLYMNSSKKICDIIENKGAKIIKVDGSKEVSGNVEKIISKLEKES